MDMQKIERVKRILEEKESEIRNKKIMEWVYSAPDILTRDLEEILKHRPMYFRGYELDEDDKILLIKVLEGISNK